MKRTKNIFGFLVIVGMATLFIFSLPTANAETRKIGVILATTGRYASMGTGEKLGATLAVKKINAAGDVNGRKLEMIFEDDEGDPGKGSTAVRKLISVEKVSAIFGSSSNVVSHAMSLITEEMKVPIIAPVPSPKFVVGKRFAFQNVGSEVLLIGKVGHYFKDIKNYKKVGILHDATEYGMNIAKGLGEWLAGKSITAVKAKFSPRASDVSPQWLILKKKKVEAVFLIGGPPMAPAIALKNRKQLGIDLPVIASPSLSNDKFLQLAGDAAEGIEMVSYFHYGKWTPGESALIGYMKKEVPKVFPTLFHALGWDAIHLIAMAMEKAGNDPVKIRDELEKTKNYPGAVGKYNYSQTNHSGLGIEILTYVKVQNGKFQFIEEYK
ncbi:MAG: ABC transporter substrate-binding protein [Deltaproteobacteria bacterium]|nr:ABC transporter substrate-binding protein [Deltaproteobacteria bacterium]